jgi:hypothetical protein
VFKKRHNFNYTSEERCCFIRKHYGDQAKTQGNMYSKLLKFWQVIGLKPMVSKKTGVRTIFRETCFHLAKSVRSATLPILYLYCTKATNRPALSSPSGMGHWYWGQSGLDSRAFSFFKIERRLNFRFCAQAELDVAT